MRWLLPVLFCVQIFALRDLEAAREKNPPSWIDSANDPATDFPLQNLPYGVFCRKGEKEPPRIGVAIGSYVLDIRKALEEGVFSDFDHASQEALKQDSLNDLMALGRSYQDRIRKRVMQFLSEDFSPDQKARFFREGIVVAQEKIDLLLPVNVGDYTDFYGSIHHALHVGSLMRPDQPLMPNYKHLPVGYHGRSSSVVVSGTAIKWPSGQVLDGVGKPMLSGSKNLDYELELGALVGRGNPQGEPISIHDAKEHIFGFVLLNDWSARDIQKWEYQPLGPFNGKNFATTIGSWVVTFAALEPFLEESKVRNEGDPVLLDYLAKNEAQALNITVEAYLSSQKMRDEGREPLLICRGNFSGMYWNFEQMLAHHTVSGCNLRPGDLLGSGTISGGDPDTLGCLLERKTFKLPPLELPDGTQRTFLEEGDEILLKAYAQKEGCPRIGFGECRGVVH